MAMGDPMGQPYPIEDKEEGQQGLKEYPISMEDKRRLGTAFVYHAPSADQPERYKKIRGRACDFAELILRHVPASRERSLALTHIEEAVMWANAGIARNE